MKMIYALCLAIMIMVFSACGIPSPTTPTQPKVEAKNPPLVSGIWSEDSSLLQGCGGTANVGVLFELLQTQGQAAVTGAVAIILDDGAAVGEFTGQVNDAGELTGMAIFKGTEQDYPFDIKVTLKDSKLQGTMTDRTAVKCNKGGSDNFVFTIALEKEDELEPNNTMAYATRLEFGKNYNLNTKGSDTDWFMFKLNTMSTLTFNVSDSAGDFGGVTYTLMDDKQSLLLYQDTLHKTSSFTKTLLPGTYFFKAQAMATDTRVSYSLEVDAREIVDVNYEPNDTLEQATQISSGFNGEFFMYRLNNYFLYQSNNTIQDIDTFKFTLTEESIVSFDMGVSGGIEYRLFHEGQQNSMNNSYFRAYEGVFEEALTAGIYYLQIQSSHWSNFVPEVNYTLTFNVSEIPDATYEPNNDLSTATPLTLPSKRDFYMGVHDEDWFIFSLTNEQVINVKGTFPEEFSYYMRASFYNQSGGLITDSGIGNGETVSVLLSAGTYYLQLAPYFDSDSSSAFAYSISLSKEFLPDVALEPNNTLDQATDISLGFSDNLFITPEDKDYFKFTLETRTKVSIFVQASVYGEVRVLNERGDSEAVFYVPYKEVTLDAGVHYLEILGLSHKKYMLSLSQSTR